MRLRQYKVDYRCYVYGSSHLTGVLTSKMICTFVLLICVMSRESAVIAKKCFCARLNDLLSMGFSSFLPSGSLQFLLGLVVSLSIHQQCFSHSFMIFGKMTVRLFF